MKLSPLATEGAEAWISVVPPFPHFFAVDNKYPTTAPNNPAPTGLAVMPQV